MNDNRHIIELREAKIERKNTNHFVDGKFLHNFIWYALNELRKENVKCENIKEKLLVKEDKLCFSSLIIWIDGESQCFAMDTRFIELRLRFE